MSGRWKSSPLILAVVALLVCPSMAFAKDKIRFGISGFGGYNTYKMTDLNDRIDALNADSVFVANGVTLEKIKHGIGLGGGLHAWVTKDILVSAEYERLLAKSKTDVTAGGSSGTVEFKIPANAFMLSGAYLFPSASKARFGVGAGLGYYSGKASAEGSSGGTTLTVGEVKGHGIGFHGVGVMDYAATSEVHVGVQVGYRVAKTTELKDSATDEVLYKDYGTTKAKADWSGLITRAGITFLFGKSE